MSYLDTEIINDDLSLNTRFFSIKENEYEVVKTEYGNSKYVYDALDTIRNNVTMKNKKMRRADLKIMIYKYKAKYLQKN